MKKTEKQPAKKQENPLINLLVNIVFPAILMIKGNKWFGFSAELSLACALSLPFFYGLYDLIVRRKYNFLSILGFISILLTGGIGLLKFPKEWIAIKEAAVPFIIGVAVLLSLKTRYPLIRTFIYSNNIIDTEKVDSHLKEHGNMGEFNKLLVRCTWLVAFSFLLSTILNFALAKILIKSETGTQAFTEELGKMTALSHVVIALPCTIILMIALWQLFKGIQKLTGLQLEDIFHHTLTDKKKLT